jgi:hypothetical protein
MDSLSPNVAVIELQAGYLFEAFKEVTAGKYTEALRKFLSETNSGFKWARHPRREKALANLKSHIVDNWDDYVNKYLPANKYDFSNNPQQFSGQNIKQTKHTCIVCSSNWTGKSACCEKCQTHLYVHSQ